jgi:hypothetical protein
MTIAAIIRGITAGACLMIPALWSAAAQQTALVEDFRYGAFVSAAAIAGDPFGNVYVTDGGAHKVVKFDAEGKLLRSVGGQGWGLDQFDHPAGIDASLGISIYVADNWNHRIVHLDRQLSAIASFSTRNDPDQTLTFGYPLDVANGRAGSFFILDGENSRIDAGENFSRISSVFGGTDAGEGRLQAPVAMSMGFDDKLYVLESARVVVYDAFGNYHGAFGVGDIQHARGIFVDKNNVWIAMADAIACYTLDGRLQSRTQRDAMVFAEKTGEFRDLLVAGQKLLLLTAENIIVFPLSHSDRN